MSKRTRVQPPIKELAKSVREGRHADAEPKIDRLARQYPASAELAHLKACCRLAAGDTVAAAAWARDALARQPATAEFHVTLGQALERQSDDVGAEQAYRNAVEYAPVGQSSGYQLLADILLRGENYAEALRIATEGLKCAPENIRLLFVAGLCSSKSGQLDEGVGYYRRVIDLRPNLAEAHNNLGNLLRRRGERAGALVAYREALRLRPDYPDACYNHAAILLETGQVRAAYRQFCDIAAIHPDMASCWGGLAEAALLPEQRTEVHALARAQLESDGSVLGPLAALCYLARFTHDWQENIETIRCWGQKLQSAKPSDHIPFLIASDYVICRWLLGQRDGLNRYLEALLSGLRQVKGDLGRTRIFFQLLLRLSQRLAGATPAISEPVVLTCIGDSHALGLARTHLVIDGCSGSVQSFFVMGAKAFHLGSAGENRFKIGLELAFSRAQKNTPVLLCFGEIDCRLWEGLIPAWRKGKFSDIDQAIDTQVQAYVDYVSSLADKHTLKLLLQGVPAPNLDWQHVSTADTSLLIATIKRFNAALEGAATRHGHRFVDAFAHTAESGGVSNKRWHIDAHHLAPEYLQHCLDNASVPAGASTATPLEGGVQRMIASGLLDEALAQLRNAAPEASQAALWSALGAAFLQMRNVHTARNCYEQATALAPSFAEAHNNLGVLLLGEKNTAAALASFEAACASQSENVEYQRNRGVLLERLGDFRQAEEVYRLALGNAPNDHRFCILLAQLLKGRNRLEESIAYYQRSLQLRPDMPEVYFNLGQVLRLLGRFGDAAAAYRAAWQRNPDFVDARVNESRALLAIGNVRDGLQSALIALNIKENQKTRALFADCLRQPIGAGGLTPELVAKSRPLLKRALEEAWTRPTYLLGAAVRLFRESSPYLAWRSCRGDMSIAVADNYAFSDSDWAALAADDLLHAALKAAPLPDMSVGDFFASLRRYCLRHGTDSARLQTGRLDVLCALASQCFINEYVFPVTDEELLEADALVEAVDASLKARRPVDPWAVACIGTYRPLYKLPHASQLLKQTMPEVLVRTLRLQIMEPLEEQRLKASIPRLTPVTDIVSAEVRQQYEENPYPRWIAPGPAGEVADFNTRMRRNFPRIDFLPLPNGEQFELLVAGCGTGQQSIEVAGNFPKACVTAIDLSLTSLAYAVRKTRERGIGNIAYSQADILQIGALERKFDVIESSGVLHHLDNPERGWKELLRLLRPGGFMNIGLYSELARKNVVAARAFIRARGFPETPEGIRACRAAMFAVQDDAPWKSICRWGDFFSTSACRDLIFHVQEHRFTLPRIQSFLAENNLRFLGFSFDSRALLAYQSRFPEDASATDLDRWNTFEHEFPDTFAGMYQFWIQKIS